MLENGEYQRVGETQTRVSRARIVAATNRDLRQEIRQGRFRADLYHRLSVFTIAVPPLRELGEDRLRLLDHFRRVFAERTGTQPFELDERARARWLAYPFPGNVRELRNIVIRLTTKFAGYTVGEADLEAEFAPPQPGASGGADDRARRGRARSSRRDAPSASMRRSRRSNPPTSTRRSRSRRATCRRRPSSSASRAARSTAGSRRRGAPVLNSPHPIPPTRLPRPAPATDTPPATPMTMYLEHFGLREAPFRITPHTEFFFAGANRGATLEALVYAITAGEGLVKVTGEVGTGKTMLCRVLMERLPETVETIYLAVPSLTRDEMLIAIASELGIDTEGANTTQLLRALQQHLIALHADGRQVVALIDEAHAMPLATLEEIRLLSNLETGKEKLLQIVLFGQPELDEHLNLPNMRQLKERITHAFGLDAAAAARHQGLHQLPAARRGLPRAGPLRPRGAARSSPTPPRGSRGASTSTPTRRCSPPSRPARTR